jgi:hypothetical protein
MTTEQYLVSGITACGGAIVTMFGIIVYVIKSKFKDTKNLSKDNRDLLNKFILLSERFAAVTEKFNCTIRETSLNQEKSMNDIADKLNLAAANVFHNQQILTTIHNDIGQARIDKGQNIINDKQNIIDKKQNIINKKRNEYTNSSRSKQEVI